MWLWGAYSVCVQHHPELPTTCSPFVTLLRPKDVLKMGGKKGRLRNCQNGSGPALPRALLPLLSHLHQAHHALSAHSLVPTFLLGQISTLSAKTPLNGSPYSQPRATW